MSRERISFPARFWIRAGLRELVPDFEKTAPLDTPVTGDAAYYLHRVDPSNFRSLLRRFAITETTWFR